MNIISGENIKINLARNSTQIRRPPSTAICVYIYIHTYTKCTTKILCGYLFVHIQNIIISHIHKTGQKVNINMLVLCIRREH